MRVAIEILVTGLTLGGMYGLSALGLNLMQMVTGILNVSHGAVMMIVGLCLASLIDRGVLSPVTAIAAGAAFGTTLLCAIFVLVLRPLLRRSELALLALTLAVEVILGGVALVVWGGRQRSYDRTFEGRVHVFGGRIDYHTIVTVTVLLVLSAGLYLLFHRTMLGLALRAAADEGGGSTAVGIVRSRMMLVSVALSGATAGIAAALIVPVLGVGPDFGARISVTVIVAAVLGGLGNLWGALLGGVTLGLLQGLLIVYAPAWYPVCQFVLLLIVMAIRGNVLVRKEQHLPSWARAARRFLRRPVQVRAS